MLKNLLVSASLSVGLMSATPAHAINLNQLSVCVTKEARVLRAKPLVNMTDLEEKILADRTSLRSFVEDAALVSHPDQNTIAKKLMRESKTCGELADKWSDRLSPARPAIDQVAEILLERGAEIKKEIIERELLAPALKHLNPKLVDGFSVVKTPGLASLAALYVGPDGKIAFPEAKGVSDREAKVAEQIKMARSASEGEQIVVNDAKTALADTLESQLKTALKLMK